MSMKLSQQARLFLGERHVAILATINRDGTPHLSGMWYELDGDEIVMNTVIGRVKERNLRRDPRASLCVEQLGTYISVSGQIRFIDDFAMGQEGIFRLAIRYRGLERAARAMLRKFSSQQRISFRMSIARILEYRLGQPDLPVNEREAFRRQYPYFASDAENTAPVANKDFAHEV